MLYNKIIPFIIAFMLATEGIFTGHTISGLPIIRLMEIIIFILLFKNFIIDIQKNKFLFVIYLFLLSLFCLLILKSSILIFFKDASVFLYMDIFRLSLYGVIIYLGYFMLIRNFKSVNIIIVITFLIYLIAFFQSEITPFTQFSQNLKLNYFNQNTVKEMSENSLFSRLTGLYSYTLVLGYAILTSSILTLYLYLKTNIKIYYYFFLFMGIVLLLTMTRSLIISWIILFIFINYKKFFSQSISNKIFVIFIIFFTSYLSIEFYLENQELLNRVTTLDDESAGGRIPLLLTGMYALINHPLGMTDLEYYKIKLEMFQIFNHPDILVFPSHNALINLGFQYTILGLISFLFFIFIIIKNYIKYCDKKLKYFFLISMLAYLLNGLVHNAFIFNMDFPILIFLSILAYEYNLSLLKQGLIK